MVPHPQREWEGIAGQGFTAFPQLQHNKIIALFHEGELLGSGKSVAGHFADRSAGVHLAVFQGADNGEEDGILAGPEYRVAIPDIFRTVPVP